MSAQVSYGQTERAVFAASSGVATRATVESGSAPTQEMDAYPVSIDGRDSTVFVAFVPVEDDATFRVTGYDARGREAASTDVSPAT